MLFVSRKKFDLENNGHTKFMVSREHYELQQNNTSKINPQKITTKIKHKVRFDANGGDSVSESERIYNLGSKYGNLPTASKSGLSFVGWHLEPECTNKIAKDSTVEIIHNSLYAKYIAQSYTVNLNSQWQNPTKWTNTDSRFVVYESFSNYNVSNGVATMYINLIGYTSFTLYINSYAESSYDYTRAYAADSSTQLTSTSGYQYNPSSYTIDSGTGWKKVTYQLDGGIHCIMICYRKDGSVNSNWDRGYVALPIQ